jgi:hypothetical protein
VAAWPTREDGERLADRAYTPGMSGDRLEQAGLNRAWISLEASLPVEWQVDGLTRISDKTPETVPRWRAAASGPAGERVEAEGEGPIGALNALARAIRPTPLSSSDAGG